MVSVIVPTYNSEQYIDYCLSSIQNQSYQDWEVIVVDDASTDNTVAIVESKIKEDSRIRLEKLPTNRGSSVARQKGIAYAEGRLITFVDADDRYCDMKALKRIVSIYDQTNADCIMYGYRTVHKYKMIFKKKFNYKYGMYTIREVAEAKACFPSPYWHYLWNKSFKAELLKSDKIAFRPELRRAQDVRFNADFIKYAKSFYVMEHAYFYEYNCCNTNQITRKKSEDSYESDMEKLLCIKEELYRLIEDYKLIGASDFAIEGIYKQCFYKLVKLESGNALWREKRNKIIEKDEAYKDCLNRIGNQKETIVRLVERENKIEKIKHAIKGTLKM